MREYFVGPEDRNVTLLYGPPAMIAKAVPNSPPAVETWGFEQDVSYVRAVAYQGEGTASLSVSSRGVVHRLEPSASRGWDAFQVGTLVVVWVFVSAGGRYSISSCRSRGVYVRTLKPPSCPGGRPWRAVSTYRLG